MSFLKIENEGPFANCWKTEQEDAYNNMFALVQGEAEMPQYHQEPVTDIGDRHTQHHQDPVTDAEYRHTQHHQGPVTDTDYEMPSEKFLIPNTCIS